MNAKNIPCTIGQNNVLYPIIDPLLAIVLVRLENTIDINGEKTGTLSWSGCVKAFLTYDPTGLRVISFTTTDDNYETQLSVEQILQYV